MGRGDEFNIVRERYPQLPKSILVKADRARRGANFTQKALEAVLTPGSNTKLSYTIIFQYHKEHQVQALVQDSIILRPKPRMATQNTPPK